MAAFHVVATKFRVKDPEFSSLNNVKWSAKSLNSSIQDIGPEKRRSCKTPAPISDECAVSAKQKYELRRPIGHSSKPRED